MNDKKPCHFCHLPLELPETWICGQCELVALYHEEKRVATKDEALSLEELHKSGLLEKWTQE